MGVLFICISLNLMQWKPRQSQLPSVKLTVTKIALPCSTRRWCDIFSVRRSSSWNSLSSLSFACRSFIAIKAISRRINRKNFRLIRSPFLFISILWSSLNRLTLNKFEILILVGYKGSYSIFYEFLLHARNFEYNLVEVTTLYNLLENK